MTRSVRIGIAGLGWRGAGLMEILLSMKDVSVPAVWEPDARLLEGANRIAAKAGRPKPEGYRGGARNYERLAAREDLDAVIIASTWELHALMAVSAMKAGKYAGVEVPVALTVEECWDLVNTCEQTKVPCMMLENWSFCRGNLAVLNMIRAGVFGRIVHCHCAHSHNCLHWYFDKDGNPRWSGRYLLKRNADQYPTHGLGPVLSWMDINCGDQFAYVTSTATASIGINRQFELRFGPDHPAVKRRYKQADIITTVVKTHKGKTLVINNDMQLPRPYDDRWMIQGTDGLYDEARSAVYIHGKSPKNEQWEPFARYRNQYEHSWWKGLRGKPVKVAQHGGPDYLEILKFVEAVRTRTAPPIDIYDSVAMSVIIPLSEQSIAKGSAPVECPDFTRGRWKKRKPVFALER
jgi:predicted dehydrogenase